MCSPISADSVVGVLCAAETVRLAGISHGSAPVSQQPRRTDRRTDGWTDKQMERGRERESWVEGVWEVSEAHMGGPT